MITSHHTSRIASQELLRWQLPQRIGAAIVLTAAEIALRMAGGHATGAGLVALVLAIGSAYIVVSAWIAASGFHDVRPGALPLAWAATEWSCWP